MVRRVVHSSQVIGPDNSQWQSSLLTFVVCDDGTMWERWNDGAWCEVPPVPQPATQEAGDATR